MTLCDYCEVAPTIDHSHVVPRFVGQYIKANSPFRHMLNLWRSKPVFDLHKGPYLCAKCDNETFSRWENYFSRSVWPDPLNSGACLSDERAIQFLVSLAYRYSLHFLATSPIERNRPYSDYLRQLTRSVLKGTSSVGRDLYLYPFVYQPITRQCGLLPGVNHLLNLGVHAESLPREGNLPNAMLVMIPKFLLLLCDGDLRASNECTMRQAVSLDPGLQIAPRTANTDLPQFLRTVLNRLIGQGQAHQKQLGLWKRLAYGVDMRLNPHKMCYVARFPRLSPADFAD